MVAPPLHDVINAPVKHIALQLVFYAPSRSCVPPQGSLWLQYMAAEECIDAVEIRTCNAKMLTYVKVNAKNASSANIL